MLNKCECKSSDEGTGILTAVSENAIRVGGHDSCGVDDGAKSRTLWWFLSCSIKRRRKGICWGVGAGSLELGGKTRSNGCGKTECAGDR